MNIVKISNTLVTPKTYDIIIIVRHSEGDVRTKSRKIDPLPSFVCKMSTLAQHPLSVRTHHKFRKIQSFLH